MRERRPRLPRLSGPSAALAVSLLAAGPVSAATGGADAPAHEPAAAHAFLAQDQPTQDFLFGRPRGWIGIRGAWLMPRANGDLFEFVSDQLSVERSDFSAPALISEAGFALTPRISVAAGIEYSRRTVESEYRRFTDNRGLPINQSTFLSQTNLAGGIKFALVEPGRNVSRLAFVPRTVAPYAGAGAGMLYYQFKQAGDFVDFVTLRVFSDLFRSKGWTPSAHVFGGADVKLWRVLFLDVEGRYVWAHGDLGSDFVGFDGIDLNGFRLSTGIRVVF